MWCLHRFACSLVPLMFICFSGRVLFVLASEWMALWACVKPQFPRKHPHTIKSRELWLIGNSERGLLNPLKLETEQKIITGRHGRKQICLIYTCDPAAPGFFFGVQLFWLQCVGWSWTLGSHYHDTDVRHQIWWCQQRGFPHESPDASEGHRTLIILFIK